jgi:hypothetical protein
MRPTRLCGRETLPKRYLRHVAGHNLSLLMRQPTDAAGPRRRPWYGGYMAFLILTPDGAFPVTLLVFQSPQPGFAAARLVRQ